MKKLTVFTLILALFLSLSSVAFAADDDNSQSQTPGPLTDETKQVTVTFTLGDGKTEVRTGTYAVKYPADYLEYVSAEPNGTDNVTKEGNVAQVQQAFVYAKTNTITVTFNVIKNVTADENVEVTFVPKGEFVSVDGKPVTVSEMTKTVPIKANGSTGGNGGNGGNTGNNVVDPGNTQSPAGNTLSPSGDPQTPAGNTNTSSQPGNTTNANSPDVIQYDQTGINIAVVAVISLVIIAGSIVLIKRK